MSEHYAVGVDVGGTKILAGVVDCSNGEVVGQSKVVSPLGADAVMAGVQQAIAEALVAAPGLDPATLRGIGVGMAGQVDAGQGVLLAAPNLGGGLTNVEVGEPLHARFGLPVLLGNDVEVAALGEARFGAGAGSDLFACVFVGTGIGGALMINGRRTMGAAGTAGEIGHMVVHAGGRQCGCGQRGHLEAYASRTAMVALLREGLEAGQETVLAETLMNPTLRIKSGMLLRAVQRGDSLTIRVLMRAGHYLGLGLANLINLWSPERIVLGGGVIEKLDLLFDVARETARAAALPVAVARTEIVRAALGDYSGVVGAARMVYERGLSEF